MIELLKFVYKMICFRFTNNLKQKLKRKNLNVLDFVRVLCLLIEFLGFFWKENKIL